MRLIDADTVATRIEEMPCYYDECIDTIEAIVEMIKYDIPPVKAIPIELYEQVRGERDVAVEQLKSLNIELFEKPYLKAITIEFLEKWFGDNYNALTDLEIAWEKENDKNI